MSEKVSDLFWKDPPQLSEAELEQTICAYKEFMADQGAFKLKSGERDAARAT